MFLFLLDQSGSMAESWGGEAGKTKAQGVADAINRLLQTLVRRCAKGDYVLDRYFIGAVGYGGQVLVLPPDGVRLSVTAIAAATSVIRIDSESRCERPGQEYQSLEPHPMLLRPPRSTPADL